MTTNTFINFTPWGAGVDDTNKKIIACIAVRVLALMNFFFFIYMIIAHHSFFIFLVVKIVFRQ